MGFLSRFCGFEWRPRTYRSRGIKWVLPELHNVVVLGQGLVVISDIPSFSSNMIDQIRAVSGPPRFVQQEPGKGLPEHAPYSLYNRASCA